MRIAQTNIVNTKLKKILEVYNKTLEFENVPPIKNQTREFLDKGTGLKNAKLQGAHLSLPGYEKNGPTLEIYQYEIIEHQNDIPPNRKGFGHIAFEVENVEKIRDKVLRNGGKRMGDITKKKIEGKGEITFVYVRDPEGNLIELQNWQ